MNAKCALRRLINGNKRFVESFCEDKDGGAERRANAAEAGQFPFAVIVSCSDSRVPPEIVFDQGIGDIFVVRTAGEVVDPIGLGSVEYAVAVLNVKLIVVLGHTDCGAVVAAVADYPAPGFIELVVEAIRPAVEKARRQQGDLLYNSIKENVNLNIYRIQSSPLIREALATDCLKIVGAIYDMDDGHVKFLF